MNNPQIALLILTVIPGLFFAVTGFRKLFFRHVREKMWAMFDRLHVPTPQRWLVAGGEFVGGLALLTGIFTQWAAIGLLFIMFGAFIMDTIPTIKKNKPDGYTGWCSKLICNPEALLITALFAIVFLGNRGLSPSDVLGWFA